MLEKMMNYYPVVLATILPLVRAQICPEQPHIEGIVAGCIIGTLAFVGFICAIAACIIWRRKRAQKSKNVTGIAYENPTFQGDDRTDDAERGRVTKVHEVPAYVLCREYETPNKDTVVGGNAGRDAVPEVTGGENDTHWSPLPANISGLAVNPVGNGKVKLSSHLSMDDTGLSKEPELVTVGLASHDIIGLGFNIRGSMRDGIYVSQVNSRGPASESGLIKAGDRIVGLSVSFENMVYEDALTILSYASPYPVEIQLRKSPVLPASLAKRPSQASINLHPLYQRSASMDDLTNMGKEPLFKPLKTHSEMPDSPQVSPGVDSGQGSLTRWKGESLLESTPVSPLQSDDCRSSFSYSSELHLEDEINKELKKFSREETAGRKSPVTSQYTVAHVETEESVRRQEVIEEPVLASKRQSEMLAPPELYRDALEKDNIPSLEQCSDEGSKSNAERSRSSPVAFVDETNEHNTIKINFDSDSDQEHPSANGAHSKTSVKAIPGRDVPSPVIEEIIEVRKKRRAPSPPFEKPTVSPDVTDTGGAIVTQTDSPNHASDAGEEAISGSNGEDDIVTVKSNLTIKLSTSGETPDTRRHIEVFSQQSFEGRKVTEQSDPAAQDDNSCPPESPPVLTNSYHDDSQSTDDGNASKDSCHSSTSSGVESGDTTVVDSEPTFFINMDRVKAITIDSDDSDGTPRSQGEGHLFTAGVHENNVDDKMDSTPSAIHEAVIVKTSKAHSREDIATARASYFASPPPTTGEPKRKSVYTISLEGDDCGSIASDDRVAPTLAAADLPHSVLQQRTSFPLDVIELEHEKRDRAGSGSGSEVEAASPNQSRPAKKRKVNSVA